MATSPLSRWDVRIVYATTLAIRAYIPRWTSLEFSDQLSDVGSGKITIDYNDNFISQFDAEFGDGVLFDGSHAIQVLRDGILSFTFLIEDVSVQRAGYAQETVIAGRGIAGQLDWAIVLPENYSSHMNTVTLETAGQQLLPRELRGYEFLARLATTVNLASTYSTNTSNMMGYLTASVNGELPAIDGVSDVGLDDTILVKEQSNTAHNGVYMVDDLGSVSTPWVLKRISTLSLYEERYVYVGARTFVNEGTTNGQKAFVMTACPSSDAGFGVSPITFAQATSVYTAVSGFYILFKEAETGYELSMSQGPTWGDVRDGYGRGGAANKVTWALSIDSVLTASEGLTDSKSSTPKDGGNITIDFGKSLLELIQSVCDQTECHWHVSPTGVVSIARKPNNLYTIPFGTDRTSGTAAVMLSLPLANSSETKTSARDMRSVVFASNNYLIANSTDTGIISTHGRREGYYTNSGNDSDTLDNIASTGLTKAAGLTFGIDIDFVETSGRQAFKNFNVGDKILIEYKIGSYEARVVNGISVSIGSDMQTSVQLTLESVIPDALVKLQNQSIYGTSQGSRLRTFAAAGNERVAAPSIKNTPVASIVGLSNKVTVSWNISGSSGASGYEASVYRTSSLNRITALSRVSETATLTSADAHLMTAGDLVTVNMANPTYGSFNVTNAVVTAVLNGTFSYSNAGTNQSGTLTDASRFDSGIKIASYVRLNNATVLTTSRAHGLFVGQKIIIDNTGDATVDYFNAVVTAVPSTTTVTYSNPGPDKTSSPSAATVRLVTESYSVRASANQTSATVEGLGTSNRPYLTRVISLNSNGEPGGSTAPTAFFSAGGGANTTEQDANALQVVGGAIKSPNFATGLTGWIIRSAGSAEFSDVQVRGQFSSGTSPNWFRVDNAGNIWSGGATLLTGKFSVTNQGILKSTSGTIGGWTIGEYTLTGGPLTLNSGGSINIYTASGASNYNLSLFSGGLTSTSYNAPWNRYTQFDIGSTQVRSNAYFEGYSVSNANIQETVIIFNNAIQLSSRPISPASSLGGGIDISCREAYVGQSVGNISIMSKDSSASIVKSIYLTHGTITASDNISSPVVTASGYYLTGGGFFTSLGTFVGLGSRVASVRVGDDGYKGGEGYNLLSIVTDTGIWGGTYNHHSGFRIGASLGAGGWGDASLHFRDATNWDTYGQAYDAMTITYGGIINAGTYLYSDIKLKENFDDLGAVLPLLNSISIKRYNMKHIKGEPKRYGFIAQEVREYFPDIIKVGKDSKNEDLLSVDTNAILSICIKSIQELSEEINQLKKVKNGN